MKYFCFLCLILSLNISCVSKTRFDDIQKENKELQNLISKIQLKDREAQTLEFKIRNIIFDLDICNTKLKRQDVKLLECVKMTEDCRK